MSLSKFFEELGEKASRKLMDKKKDEQTTRYEGNLERDIDGLIELLRDDKFVAAYDQAIMIRGGAWLGEHSKRRKV